MSNIYTELIGKYTRLNISINAFKINLLISQEFLEEIRKLQDTEYLEIQDVCNMFDKERDERIQNLHEDTDRIRNILAEIEDGIKDLEEYFSTRLKALKSLSDIRNRPNNLYIEEPTGILSTKEIGKKSPYVENSIGISIKKIGKVPTDNIEEMRKCISEKINSVPRKS